MKDQRERFAEALGCSSAAITLTIIDLEHCDGDYLPVLEKLKRFKEEIKAYKKPLPPMDERDYDFATNYYSSLEMDYILFH